VTRPVSELRFGADRIAALIDLLEVIAAGDTRKRLPLSAAGDELDAIAYGINVLVGELGWATARMVEAQEARAAELREAVAQAERANAAKDIFLRNVSHEIRTPIATMLGFANLLASGDLSAADRVDLLQRLHANGRAVLSLLSDLLDQARLKAERLELAAEPVSVVDLVREVLTSVEIECAAKGLHLQVEAVDDALGTLETDRLRLRQILVNLVTNALKFTETGGITVSLQVTSSSNGIVWMIDVSDTGIGIARDRQPYLFNPFEQANASIVRTYGGTGLGLALSRGLAERLGGTLVLLRSDPGAGSTFRLALPPLSVGRDADARADSKPPIATRRPGEGMRILLVEDHRDMRLTLTRLLEQAGASVDTACDGREALVKVSAGAFDLVLMDLLMPNMDGYQATRALRAQGSRMPIVALTADPTSACRIDALDAGCDACVYKGFTIEEVFASIQKQRT